MSLHAQVLDTLDLESLRTLEAVYLERNVARAALRLGVSQPLVSQRLTRLRLLFQDQLFVRAPRGVAPTELTRSIAPTIHRVLNELREIMLRGRSFDAASAHRQFVIQMSDSAEMAFLPGLYRHVRACAPGVDIRCVRTGPTDSLLKALDDQSVHLAIGMFGQLSSEFERAHLLTQDYQLVMSESHPLRKDSIDIADLAELDFLMIGDYHDIENLMAEHGLLGRIRQRIGHYLAAPVLLREGSLVAWLPRSLVDPLRVYGDYRAVSLANIKQVFSLSAIRSQRGQRDPGVNWLWHTVIDLIRAQAPEPGRCMLER